MIASRAQIRSRSVRWYAGGALTILLGGAAQAQCPDCDGDGRVGVSDLVTGVSIALGVARLSACPVMDDSGDGTVSIDELVRAISAALGGCELEASPTPTETAPLQSPTPTATVAAGPSPPPADPTALLAWLQAGNYLAWMRESAPHPSAGPHGGVVQTYVNDVLFESLSGQRDDHPAGAAAVKELYLG